MTKQHISYKFRAYPTNIQRNILNQWLGCSRFVWNAMLNFNKEKYEQEQKFAFNIEMCNKLPAIKKDINWLKQVPAQILQQKCNDLSAAIHKKIKNDCGFPKFKSKHHDQSGIRFPQQWHISGNRINLPKMKGLKFKQHREMVGKMSSLTVKKDRCGDFWIIILCSFERDLNPIDVDNCVGIDVGLKNFAVTSDGEVFDNPKFLRNNERKLKREHKSLSRKQKGSNNRNKQRIVLARQYIKIANQRKDFINKFVSTITKRYDVICIEDLNIAGMTKNHKLAKSICDASWGMMYTKLAQKCEMTDKLILKVDRFAPTSKTCSCCGVVQDMPLHKREFKCSSCDIVMDRDLNAAINIKNWVIKERDTVGTAEINGCGNMNLVTHSAQQNIEYIV